MSKQINLKRNHDIFSDFLCFSSASLLLLGLNLAQYHHNAKQNKEHLVLCENAFETCIGGTVQGAKNHSLFQKIKFAKTIQLWEQTASLIVESVVVESKSHFTI